MLYVITHKEFNDYFLKNVTSKIINVGESKIDNELYISDKNGINIHDKNFTYCELTGIYYVWKNEKHDDNDIVGFEHYRRFFITKNFFSNFCLAVDYEFEIQLNKVDMILPIKQKVDKNLYEHYSYCHYEEDMHIVRDIIKNNHNDYLNAFDMVMSADAFYAYNMFITKWQIFNEYANWLFHLLFEIEKEIDFSKYRNNYQKRVMGFIAERLINVWITHNKLKTLEFPIIEV